MQHKISKQAKLIKSAVKVAATFGEEGQSCDTEGAFEGPSWESEASNVNFLDPDGNYSAVFTF